MGLIIMKFTFKLKENLLQRNAANLVFSLSEIPESIYIYRDNDERRVSGKSLIGILSGHFLQTDTIEVETNGENWSRVQEIFKEYGDLV